MATTSRSIYPYTPYEKIQGTKLEHLLFRTPEAKKSAAREYQPQELFVKKDISALDPKFNKLKKTLAWRLRDYTTEIDDRGLAVGSGIIGDFNGLLHISGFGTSGDYPACDNTVLRDNHGLVNHYVEEWHKKLAISVIKWFFTGLEPQAQRFNPETSTMFPMFKTGKDFKMQFGLNAMKNAPSAGKLVMQGKYLEASAKYGLPGIYNGVYRLQTSDKIKVDWQNHSVEYKNRPITDLLWSVSSGKKGSMTIADKRPSSVGFGPEFDMFSLCRRRFANGIGFGMTAALGPVATSVRKKIYVEGAATYHHTTRQKLEEDVKDKLALITADVANHDKLYPMFFFDTVVEVLKELGFADWWVALFEAKQHLPVFVSSPGIGLPNVLLGSVNHADMNFGLPSGNPFTSEDGKMEMTWVYLITQIEHTTNLDLSNYSQLAMDQFFDSYVRGKLPFSQKNQVDDVLMLWDKTCDLAKIEHFREKLQQSEDGKYQGKMISPYMIIGYEEGSTFLGQTMLFSKAAKDLSEVRVIGRMTSALINDLCPEYSATRNGRLDSKGKRPYPGISWGSYQDVYGTAPTYHEIMEIINEEWFNVYGLSYASLRQKEFERDSRRLSQDLLAMGHEIEYAGLTAIEREVIQDPDKLAYKYSVTDVREEVLNMLFSGLSLEITEPYFNSIVGRQ